MDFGNNRVWFELACTVATKSTCRRSKCGSIIVKNNRTIGRGFNSPPGNDERQRRCECSKENLNRKITDKTCCVHAETRAIFDALRHNPKELPNSILYFVRLDEQNRPTPAGMPYCTICSKLALDAGISQFVLWHNDGVRAYDTAEYNVLSYQYNGA